MDSLTKRLSFLMNQVMENEIAEIVIQSHTHRQTLVQSQVPSNRVSLTTVAALRRGKKKSKSEVKQTPVPKKIVSPDSIWGAKPVKAKEDHGREQKELPKTKFIRVAKFLTLMSSLKQGVDVCTCASLEANCKLHDT